MKPTKHISDVFYAMQISGGGDVWRISGVCEGKPLMPGFPININSEQDTFETGQTVYVIDSYSCDKKLFWEQVTKDIQNNGFEVH